jgi:hypothetical protein
MAEVYVALQLWPLPDRNSLRLCSVNWCQIADCSAARYSSKRVWFGFRLWPGIRHTRLRTITRNLRRSGVISEIRTRDLSEDIAETNGHLSEIVMMGCECPWVRNGVRLTVTGDYVRILDPALWMDPPAALCTQKTALVHTQRKYIKCQRLIMHLARCVSQACLSELNIILWRCGEKVVFGLDGTNSRHEILLGRSSVLLHTVDTRFCWEGAASCYMQ